MRGSRWISLVVATVAATVVVGVAGAGNGVLNSGFEQSCGGSACNWSTIGNGGIIQLIRDLIDPESGVASLKIISTNSVGGGGAISACITGISSGSATASFEYRTTDTSITSISYTPNYWTNSTCSGVPSIATSGPQATPPWSPLDEWTWRGLSRSPFPPG